MGRQDDKYMWANRGFENWMKNETKKVRESLGIKISPAEGTRLLKEKILIPKHISLLDIFNPQRRKDGKKRKHT